MFLRRKNRRIIDEETDIHIITIEYLMNRGATSEYCAQKSQLMGP